VELIDKNQLDAKKLVLAKSNAGTLRHADTLTVPITRTGLAIKEEEQTRRRRARGSDEAAPRYA
jgi:hypothetical protein